MVVRSFIAEAPEQLRALERAVLQAQWRDSMRFSHTLKSLAAAVGAETLSRLASQSELNLGAAETAEKLDPAGMHSMLANLWTALRRTLEALREIVPDDLPEVSAASFGALPQGPERQQLSAFLDVLAGLLAENNMQSTVLSAELVQRFGGVVGQPLAEINATVQRLAFEAALQQCRSLGGRLV
jgi:HPt (histidine-containing phosphotransfer) domain-containing protein